LWGCFLGSLPKSWRVCVWLLKIILPISLAVRLLQYTGWLGTFAGWMEPAFGFIGLPGETAIVFITSVFCPLYAPIALITSMSLGLREATILTLMCLVSHNLILESSVQAKTGSGFWEMTALRIGMSFVIALSLHAVMPRGDWGVLGVTADAEMCGSLGEVLGLWLRSSLRVVVTILVVVTALIILHAILEEFRLMGGLSGVFAPMMRLFGLPCDAAFLWIVGNVVGLAYGGAIMMEYMEEGKLSRREGNLLNYHLAMNHSLLEDTIIFVAIGIPVLWIILTRFTFAIIVVWLRRGYNRLRDRYTHNPSRRSRQGVGEKLSLRQRE